MDEPADPFENPIPPEILDAIREQHESDTADAFEQLLREFSAAKLDYRALLEQESWRSTVLAILTIAATEDVVRLSAIILQAIGRARYQTDPDGFSTWLRG
jgi:hypothetical protein